MEIFDIRFIIVGAFFPEISFRNSLPTLSPLTLRLKDKIKAGSSIRFLISLISSAKVKKLPSFELKICWEV